VRGGQLQRLSKGALTPALQVPHGNSNAQHEEPYSSSADYHQSEVIRDTDELPPDTDNKEATPPSKRKWYLIFAVVLVLAIGGGVAGALASSGGGDDPDNISTPSPIESERLVALRDFLIQQQISPNQEQQLKDSSSPQFQALTWLADVDTELSVLMNEGDVITRYVLAVFYCSLNSPNMLDPTRNVCDWQGVKCSNGTVEAIEELSLIGLTGTLPQELNALSSLTSLYIEGNGIQGLQGPLTNLREYSGARGYTELIFLVIASHAYFLFDWNARRLIAASWKLNWRWPIRYPFIHF
jgi:hypothetical protein